MTGWSAGQAGLDELDVAADIGEFIGEGRLQVLGQSLAGRRVLRDDDELRAVVGQGLRVDGKHESRRVLADVVRVVLKLVRPLLRKSDMRSQTACEAAIDEPPAA